MGTVETAAALGLPQAGRHFVMMEAAIVDAKVGVAWHLRHIAVIRVGVGHIRLGGVAHRARTLILLRGRHPVRV